MSAKLTEKRQEILDFINSVYETTGGGCNVREIATHLGHRTPETGKLYTQAVVSHIDALVELGLVVKTVNKNGRAKGNGIFPANKNAAASVSSRTGDNYAVNIVGNFVAFMIFADGKMIESGLYPVEAALGMADKIKAAPGSTIDRIEAVAKFTARRRIPQSA